MAKIKERWMKKLREEQEYLEETDDFKDLGYIGEKEWNDKKNNFVV